MELTPKEPSRVAFVGAGYMGGEHARAFAAAGATLAGVMSRTRSRSEALAGKFPSLLVCDSIEELRMRTQADLVVVSVPELHTRNVLEACFRFPWKVLVEKPAGFDLVEAERIRNAGRGHSVFVALNRRYYSSTMAVRGGLASDQGHRVVHVVDQEDPEAARRAGQPEVVVSNWMYANSIHVVDCLRVFARGEADEVEIIEPFDPESPSSVVASVRFSSGDLGLYQGLWNRPGPWSATISTPERFYEMRPLEQAQFRVRTDRQWHAIPAHPRDSEFKPGLMAQAEDALRACRGESHLLPTLDDAFASMQLVARIFEPKQGAAKRIP